MRTGRACCQHCADDPVHDVPVDGHELPCDVCDDARFEAELRERIAQEIEVLAANLKRAVNFESHERRTQFIGMVAGLERAAHIARGQR